LNVPRHVVLISLDCLRFDCLGCEDNQQYLKRHRLDHRVRTPTLDELAGKGVRFSQAICTAPYTTSSHASIFTGLYPPRHGLRAFLTSKLSGTAIPLAEKLRSNGFVTIRSADGASFFSLAGLDRGVDHCLSRADHALFDVLKEHRRDHVYLFVHFFDLHEWYGFCEYPYRQHHNADFRERVEQLRRLYGTERADSDIQYPLVKDSVQAAGHYDVLFREYIHGITKFDQGRLAWFMRNLAETGILDDALLVLFSDHGEAIRLDSPSDAQRILEGAPVRIEPVNHGGPLTEEVIRVPLILSAPGGLPEGEIIDDQVSLADIMPTVLDILGIDPESDPACTSLDGRSLLPLIEGEPAEDRAVYSESWVWSWDDHLEFVDRCEKAGELLVPNHKASLYQRSIRTPQSKLIIQGDVPVGESSLLDKLKPANSFRDIWPFNLDVLPGCMLFDIQNDPFEERNLLCTGMAGQYAEVTDTLYRVLDRVCSAERAVEEEAIGYKSEEEIEEMKRQLRGLGYI